MCRESFAFTPTVRVFSKLCPDLVAIEIIYLLKVLKHRDLNILFFWIPENTGIIINAIADNVTKTLFLPLEREVPYFYPWEKNCLALHLRMSWQKTWDDLTYNKIYLILALNHST